MNRLKIKEEAKKTIEGNKWNLWIPLLIIIAVGFVWGLITFNVDQFSVVGMTLEILYAFITVPLTIGLYKYVLDITRGKKFDVMDLFNSYKKVLMIVAASILMSIIVSVGLILLIVPGIIAALALAMTYYIIADGEEDPIEALKKSNEMMKGYKWDYFVFTLSFIGWILLACITLGIALIWIYPYMIVAFALYYDKLKQKTFGKEKAEKADDAKENKKAEK